MPSKTTRPLRQQHHHHQRSSSSSPKWLLNNLVVLVVILYSFVLNKNNDSLIMTTVFAFHSTVTVTVVAVPIRFLTTTTTTTTTSPAVTLQNYHHFHKQQQQQQQQLFWSLNSVNRRHYADDNNNQMKRRRRRIRYSSNSTTPIRHAQLVRNTVRQSVLSSNTITTTTTTAPVINSSYNNHHHQHENRTTIPSDDMMILFGFDRPSVVDIPSVVIPSYRMVATASILILLLSSSTIWMDTADAISTSVQVTAVSATATAVSATTAASSSNSVDWEAIVQTATKKALSGGQAGALAAVFQVGTLMWLRTCMNYQYRYGGTLLTSLNKLYTEGGIGRLYQGLPFAIVQGPLTRFGDTAANVGILSLLESIPYTASALPLPIKTLCGSIAAGLWRIVLMPIDTSKTSLQVEGARGLQQLINTTLAYGPGVLYRGSLAQAAATAVGHFPWFLTYNFFNDLLPMVDTTTTSLTAAAVGQDPNTLMLLSLGRSALLGVLASCVSDCSSNSLRVIKTTKQTAQLNMDDDVDDSLTHIANTTTIMTITDDNNTTSMNINADRITTKKKEMTYGEVIQLIIDQDGIVGLFGRGLQTRLLTNAIQGAMFSVLWKYFQSQQ